MQKCKSHQSKAKLRAFSAEQQAAALGNDVADANAKEGASMDTMEDFRSHAARDEADRIKGVLHYTAEFSAAAQVGGSWPDVVPWPRWPPKKAGRAARGHASAPPQRAHDVIFHGSTMKCRR